MIAYLPAMLVALVLLGIGSIPDMPGPQTELPLDKLAHFLMYGALGWFAARGWRRVRRPRMTIVIAAALLVGIADELNQSRLSGRSAELADWLMDAAGIGCAFLIVARRDRNTELKA